MSREFTQLDGTLDNVGNRIVQDYNNAGFSCHYTVGNICARHLEDKLQDKRFKSLGFTSDRLTIPLPELEVSNSAEIDRIVDELYNYGVVCGDHFKSIYPSEEQELAYLKEHKHEIRYMSASDRVDLHRKLNINSEPNGVKRVFIDIINSLGTRTAFYDNTPHKSLFGMKPSKFLKRFIEKHIEGIGERYALAVSERHTLKPHLTLDPNIMINCSEAATFSSCYTFDGEYHYSAQRFANSSETLMAVVFNENGSILYRNWVLVNHDRTSVISFGGYTSIRGTLQDTIKDEVHKFILGTDKLYLTDSDVISDGDTYLDASECYSLYAHNKWGLHNDYGVLGKAYDISDGDNTDEACVSSTYCDHCGDSDYGADTYYVEHVGNVCDYCIDEHYTHVDGHGYVHDSNVVCNDDDEPYHIDDISDEHTEIGGVWYSNDDIEEAYDDDAFHLRDDLYYSEQLDRYYECNDRLLEDEAELEAEEA